MKKWFLIIIILISALAGIFIYDYKRFNDGLLHVAFCDVGQGDAVFIRTPGGKNILIDAGPDKSIINCLSSHMPFWDRTIHKMILSHPHDDHFFGMQFVLDRYNVLSFDTEDIINDTEGFKGLMRKLHDEKSVRKKLFAGDFLKASDGVRVDVKSPTIKRLDLMSPNKLIAEKGEQASLIQHLQYGEFDLYLSSDNDTEIIDATFERQKDPIEVFQVPHHGSRYGLTEELLVKINPQIAVISVGKNKYGHPSKEILEILRDQEIKILRTDEEGDIEIVTDGKNWQIK